MTDEQINTMQKLREMGATRIEVKPDGTVVAEFGSPPAPTFVPVPQPYPVYPYPPPFGLGQTWLGDPAGLGDHGDNTPRITWRLVGDNGAPHITSTEWDGEHDNAIYCPHARLP